MSPADYTLPTHLSQLFPLLSSSIGICSVYKAYETLTKVEYLDKIDIDSGPQDWQEA